jgi:hypothetical protein
MLPSVVDWRIIARGKGQLLPSVVDWRIIARGKGQLRWLLTNYGAEQYSRAHQMCNHSTVSNHFCGD